MYYTSDLCLTQRICVGLLLSGVIALKPLRSAYVASLWQEHLVTHKPVEAPELWQSCSGRFMYSISVPQPAAQAGTPTRCHRHRVRQAELALPHLEPSPTAGVADPLVCVVQGGAGSQGDSREKNPGMGYDGSRTLTGTPASYSFRMSRASLCCISATCHATSTGLGIQGPKVRFNFSPSHGPSQRSGLGKG